VSWTPLSSGATGFLTVASPGYVYTLPGGAPASGVLEVMFVCSDERLTSVSSGGGASWTVQETYNNFASNNTLWRVTNGSEGTSVDVLLGGAGYSSSLRFMRWSGQAASPLDTGAASTSGSGTASPSLSSGTLAGTGELVVAFAGMTVGSNITPSGISWSSGFTDDGNGAAQEFESTDSVAIATWGAYDTSAGTAAVSAQATWTFGSMTQTYTQLVAFKPGGAVFLAPPSRPRGQAVNRASTY